MKKPTKNTRPTTIEALAKTMVATTAVTEKFQAVVYTLRKSLGLNSSVKAKAVDANWTNQLLGLLRLIEGVESAKNTVEVRLAYQQRLLGLPNESRSGELFEFRENYKLFLRQSARDIPWDLEKFFDALQEAIEQAV